MGQLKVLYKHYQKRLKNKMEFEAAIVGAKVKGGKQIQSEDKFAFKKPEDYENLSMQERRELTKQMMAHNKFLYSKSLGKKNA